MMKPIETATEPAAVYFERYLPLGRDASGMPGVACDEVTLWAQGSWGAFY